MDLSHFSDNIDNLSGILFFIKDDFLRNKAGLILHEIQSINHIIDCNFSVYSYAKQTDHGWLKGIVHRECWSLPFLHVKRDLF